MSIPLAHIARCLQGEIPAILATCSADGEPNLVHVSQVILVDDVHVATSNQFFSKTAANLLQNPVATLLCPHPDTGISYKLLIQHERSETTGPRFESPTPVANSLPQCSHAASWSACSQSRAAMRSHTTSSTSRR